MVQEEKGTKQDNAKDEQGKKGEEKGDDDDDDGEMLSQDLESMTLVELKERCEERGLKKSGKKAELIQRLREQTSSPTKGKTGTPPQSSGRYDGMSIDELRRLLKERRLGSGGAKKALIERLLISDRDAEKSSVVMGAVSPAKVVEPEVDSPLVLEPETPAKKSAKTEEVPKAKLGRSEKKPNTAAAREEAAPRGKRGRSEKKAQGDEDDDSVEAAVVGKEQEEEGEEEEEAMPKGKRGRSEKKAVVVVEPTVQQDEEEPQSAKPRKAVKGAKRGRSERKPTFIEPTVQEEEEEDKEAEPEPPAKPKKEATTKRGRSESGPFWYWAGDVKPGDQKIWKPFDSSVAVQLEAARVAGKKRCEIGEGRFVDLESWVQRVHHDAKKRRAVLRADEPLVDLNRASVVDADDEDQDAAVKPGLSAVAGSSEGGAKGKTSTARAKSAVGKNDSNAATAKGKRKPSKKGSGGEDHEAPSPAAAAASVEPNSKRSRSEKESGGEAPRQKSGVAREAVVISHSGLKDTKDVDKLVASLGVEIEGEVISRATYLVMGKFVRTVKALSAINLGCALVRLEWVQECIKQGRIVDAAPFAIVDKAAEQKYGFTLHESVRRAQSGARVFAGLNFALTDKTQPTPAQLKAIIECGGGKVVPLPLRGKIADDVLVIGQEADKAVCKKLIDEGRTSRHVYDVELILSSSLRQQVDLTTNILVENAKESDRESAEF